MSTPDPLALPGLPRDETGPVFAEPWQAQAFALTLQLHERGVFTWKEWAETLARRIEDAGPTDDGSRYYEHWLAALEELVTSRQLAASSALRERRKAWEEAYRRTPHGHPVELGGEPAR